MVRSAIRAGSTASAADQRAPDGCASNRWQTTGDSGARQRNRHELRPSRHYCCPIPRRTVCI
eukprot:1310196-Pleurochrysis_carterae.AAC.1